jgi:hypothetical protein
LLVLLLVALFLADWSLAEGKHQVSILSLTVIIGVVGAYLVTRIIIYKKKYFDSKQHQRRQQQLRLLKLNNKINKKRKGRRVMNQMTTTNNTTTEYFKCNICNYKFVIPKKESSSSFNAKYEHEYVNLLSDMRKHIDRHREERPNHKIPATMLLNLFTRVVQDQQGKGRGGRPKGRKNKRGDGTGGPGPDDDRGTPAAAPVPTTTPKPR